eukprot:149530_1
MMGYFQGILPNIFKRYYQIFARDMMWYFQERRLARDMMWYFQERRPNIFKRYDRIFFRDEKYSWWDKRKSGTEGSAGGKRKESVMKKIVCEDRLQLARDI